MGGVSVGGPGAGFGFTTAGAAASAAFFAASRAASRASCLAAKSFASAAGSAGDEGEAAFARRMSNPARSRRQQWESQL